jgi:glutamine amidotransferase
MSVKKNVVIIDYQLGNLFSVNQSLINIGLAPTISSDPRDIYEADAIVLPGVGAFGDAMKNLRDLKLVDPIRDFVETGKPLLGICLGLQLLFTKSEEFGSSEGLSFIKGRVRKFRGADAENSLVRVPQIAWNTISLPSAKTWKNTPLHNIKEGADMYFVHSYYVEPDDKAMVLTETVYGDQVYTSSILYDNIFACQFHPEKSAAEGLKIYYNWAFLNKLL